MIRIVRCLPPLFFLVLLVILHPSTALAHQPTDVYSARADLRVDDQRGLRVRVWFEVPDGAVGDLEALRAELSGCLPLTLDDEALAGSWARGDDPKDGLSNGSHTLVALEFEPKKPFTEPVTDKTAAKRFELTLRVECFDGEDLALAGNVRAREPWRAVEASVPEAMVSEEPDAADHHRGHDTPKPATANDASRTVRVIFARSD